MRFPILGVRDASDFFFCVWDHFHFPPIELPHPALVWGFVLNSYFTLLGNTYFKSPIWYIEYTDIFRFVFGHLHSIFQSYRKNRADSYINKATISVHWVYYTWGKALGSVALNKHKSKFISVFLFLHWLFCFIFVSILLLMLLGLFYFWDTKYITFGRYGGETGIGKPFREVKEYEQNTL